MSQKVNLKRKLITKASPKGFKLQLHVSEYSKLYKKYMQNEYSAVETMIKKIIQMPFCSEYYLKYPLDGILKGICKKLLINMYELVVLGYFLSQVDWKLQNYILEGLFEIFPNVIHVNQPTDPQKLKQISIFIYFSAYSIKQLLNEDISIYQQQMLKVFPDFENIQHIWTGTQRTVGQVLNLKVLNHFFKQSSSITNLIDYNICVDKILQISPCYDIANKNDKSHQKEVLNFGFMGMHQVESEQKPNESSYMNENNGGAGGLFQTGANGGSIFMENHQGNQGDGDGDGADQQLQDEMDDFKFDGDI